MKDFLFMVYACEEQKKEDFINALAQEEDPNDPMIQDAIAYRLGLDLSSLTSYDRDYIEREVSKRWTP